MEGCTPHVGFRFINFIISLPLNTLVTAGILTVFLKARDDPASTGFKDLWQPQYFLNLLGTIVLVDLILAVGFMLLIVPGIIFALMFSYAVLSVIDKGLGPMAAFKESARITKGHRWDLLISCLVSMIAMIHVFRTLCAIPPNTINRRDLVVR